MLDGELNGTYEERSTTVAGYLREWLATRKRGAHCEHLRRIRGIRSKGLDPRVRTPPAGPAAEADRRLGDRAAEGWLGPGRDLPDRLNAAQRAERRGPAVATAVNPARHCVPPKPHAEERTCWTPEEAAAFLRYIAKHYADRLADLFGAVLGTGTRRGEILALHWSDVHLMDRKLFVRWPLSAVNNNALHFNQPKTKASRAWISLSPSAMAALHRQSRALPLPSPDSVGRSRSTTHQPVAFLVQPVLTCPALHQIARQDGWPWIRDPRAQKREAHGTACAARQGLVQPQSSEPASVAASDGT